MSTQETSQRVRLLQIAARLLDKEKKARQLRWTTASEGLQAVLPPTALPNLSTRNLNSLNPLKVGSFLIARNNARTFVAEILDLYKKGSNNRYGSVESAASVDALAWFSVRVYLPLTMVNNEVDDDEDLDPNLLMYEKPVTFTYPSPCAACSVSSWPKSIHDKGFPTSFPNGGFLGTLVRTYFIQKGSRSSGETSYHQSTWRQDGKN